MIINSRGNIAYNFFTYSKLSRKYICTRVWMLKKLALSEDIRVLGGWPHTLRHQLLAHCTPHHSHSLTYTYIHTYTYHSFTHHSHSHIVYHSFTRQILHYVLDHTSTNAWLTTHYYILTHSLTHSRSISQFFTGSHSPSKPSCAFLF